MPRLETAVAAALNALGVGVCTCAIAACQSSTTPIPYTPITGVIVRSSALVAGLGCGTGVDQVYRYVAVVTFAPTILDAGHVGGPDAGRDAGPDAGRDAGPDAGRDAGPDAGRDAGPDAGRDSGSDAGPNAEVPSTMTWTNISECFTDSVFENLTTLDSQQFDVAIFAYNKQGYDDAQLPADLSCVPDGGGAPCKGGFISPISAHQEALASWTTSCIATQQQGAPVLAVCNPLAPPAESDASAPSSDAEAEAAASDATPSEAATTESGARDAQVGD